MNKSKIAVFVEGQTELVFVREFLKMWYGYDANEIGFSCYSLHSNQYHDTSYSLGSEDSSNYYIIVNVGNDNSVLSKVIARVGYLRNKGYQMVIGLRDMYSKMYVQDVKNHKINDKVTQDHISDVKGYLKKEKLDDFVDIHFAIMEIEAWFLGMPHFFEGLSESLTKDNIESKVGINIDDDPEKTYFHPAVVVNKIYRIEGKQYDKHLSEISSIMSHLTKEDFVQLMKSGKCLSFKNFVESLVQTSSMDV